MAVEQNDEDIEAQYDEAVALVAEDANPYPAMTYMQGVRDALGWVLGESEDPPVELPA